MILYFISALLMSLALMKLGSYSAIVYMFSTGAKALVVLLLAAALVMLLKKLWGMYRRAKLPPLP